MKLHTEALFEELLQIKPDRERAGGSGEWDGSKWSVMSEIFLSVTAFK